MSMWNPQPRRIIIRIQLVSISSLFPRRPKKDTHTRQKNNSYDHDSSLIPTLLELKKLKSYRISRRLNKSHPLLLYIFIVCISLSSSLVKKTEPLLTMAAHHFQPIIKLGDCITKELKNDHRLPDRKPHTRPPDVYSNYTTSWINVRTNSHTHIRHS